MHIGICMFATDYAIRIDELAREAEAAGIVVAIGITLSIGRPNICARTLRSIN